MIQQLKYAKIKFYQAQKLFEARRTKETQKVGIFDNTLLSNFQTRLLYVFLFSVHINHTHAHINHGNMENLLN